MTDIVLCINAGSSSIKFQIFEAAPGRDPELRCRGQLEGIAVEPRLLAQGADGRAIADERFDARAVPNADAAMPHLLQWLRARFDGALPDVVGHRVVFGGTRYAEPVSIDDRVLEHLRSLVSLMPLHLPPALVPIEAIREKLPDLAQVAVFDTGFHHDRDELTSRLPIPEALHREGVRRYGFHGISYEYIAGRLPEVAPEIAGGRVVVAHLRRGGALCAMVDGRSVDATMGFSGLDGLPMGTRPGRLDPGVVLYLFQAKGLSVEEVEDLLYRECGLKGLSGISNDVRALLASDDPRAKMALDYFTLHAARAVADLATVMGGIDGLVFTAGVGENAAPVRAAIGARLAWLGVDIDEAANATNGPRISTAGSRIACYVVPTDEERMIARHSLALLRARTG